jgi:hypothetical protein
MRTRGQLEREDPSGVESITHRSAYTLSKNTMAQPHSSIWSSGSIGSICPAVGCAAHLPRKNQICDFCCAECCTKPQCTTHPARPPACAPPCAPPCMGQLQLGLLQLGLPLPPAQAAMASAAAAAAASYFQGGVAMRGAAAAAAPARPLTLPPTSNP